MSEYDFEEPIPVWLILAAGAFALCALIYIWIEVKIYRGLVWAGLVKKKE